jgi:hypothetical protein
MIWTILLAAVIAAYLYFTNRPHGMGEKVTCPHCGSDNVHIEKRGYSFRQGLSMAIAMLLLRILISTVEVKAGVKVESTLVDNLLLSAGIGLLFGFIGARNLQGRCIACGKTFRL